MVNWYPHKPDYLISFNDVLLRPQHSILESRFDSFPFFHCRLGDKTWHLSPIIVANMSSLATVEMYMALSVFGILVPFHRFQSIEAQMADIAVAKEQRTLVLGIDGKGTGPFAPVSATVGLHDRTRTDRVCASVDIVFLEVAHADSVATLQEISYIKRGRPDIGLVVGNIGTREAALRLYEAGADIVKVGIGSGSCCSTRIVTGCGVPQLSSVFDCSVEGRLLISDGGHTCGGDIVKSLAAGAKFVMLGSLFAGTDETGQSLGDGTYLYRGMASKDAQIERDGELRSGVVPEGISARVPSRGSARAVAEELIGSIRQGMAMVGAATLDDLREKAVFQLVSPNVVVENQPHILFRGGK